MPELLTLIGYGLLFVIVVFGLIGILFIVNLVMGKR